jgi:hypothetical protein
MRYVVRLYLALTTYHMVVGVVDEQPPAVHPLNKPAPDDMAVKLQLINHAHTEYMVSG